MINRFYKEGDPVSTLQISEKQKIKPYNIFTLIFIFLMILANLASSKIVIFYENEIISSFYLYPIAILAISVISEVYGFRSSRRIIFMTFLMSFIWILLLYLTVHFPNAPGVETNAHYNLVMSLIAKSSWGSLFGFLISGYINSIFISKLKLILVGKYRSIRIIASSIFGIWLYSFISSYHQILVFDNMNFMKILFISGIFGSFMCIFLYPLISFLIDYLKDNEQLDHYDFKTKFGIF
jgi:uncharacterized PurR-regulated membrane protein YhhQ (DUF165 family)